MKKNRKTSKESSSLQNSKKSKKEYRIIENFHIQTVKIKLKLSFYQFILDQKNRFNYNS